MKKKRWKRILSVVLSAAVLNTTVCSGFVSSAADVPSQTVVEEETPDVEVIQDDQKEPAVDKIEDEKEETSFGDGSALYQNGAIYIYHEEQLKAIGTGAVVHDGDAEAETFGKGLEVTDDAGNAVTYSLNAKYVLANDIPLTSAEIWQLPAGFTGEFFGEDAAKDAHL